MAGVLQRDTLDPYLFIICLDNVLRTSVDEMKDNGLKVTKERSRKYPTQANTDADYPDDIALLANIPAQAETLLHSLERAHWYAWCKKFFYIENNIRYIANKNFDKK